MKIRNHDGYTFDDILLVPQLGVVESRNDVSVRTKLTKNKQLGIPIVAAPMSSVTGIEMAKALGFMDGFSFLHRNQTLSEQRDAFITVRQRHQAVGCAFGINETPKERLAPLISAGCEIFILDVAHAHTTSVAKWLDQLSDYIWDKTEIIIGSVATAQAIQFFQSRFPIAAFRVGIGPGAACTTRERTGFGMPQLSALDECVKTSKVPIIADGGIKNSGDIVKALAVGASSVMLGRLLAGANEAPHPGHYYGMASERAKMESNCSKEFIEGVEGVVSLDGPLESIINNLLWGIKSGISYGGAANIEGLQKNAEAIIVSNRTHIESATRL